MLPVLTKPEVVHQAVAGILSGQVGLSLLNVEALLVLANAVGVSHMGCTYLQLCVMRLQILSPGTCVDIVCFCAVCRAGNHLCEVPE